MGKRSNTRPKKSSAVTQAHFVSRRELLSGVAATLACSFVPLAASASPQAQISPSLFTAKERRTLEAMISRLIPADENGPGAIEAGCVRYIERALADAYRSSKDTYSSGLEALDSYAKKVVGASIASLNAAEQDKILTAFEQNTPVGSFRESGAFFELVLAHTWEGMFGDPFYGGNANFAGWDLIGYPGPRLYVSPEMQQMNAKTPRSRVSAKRLMHDTH